MAADTAPRLDSEVREWLRYLWRKATTPDDWSRGGEPHPWDRYKNSHRPPSRARLETAASIWERFVSVWNMLRCASRTLRKLLKPPA